MTNIDQMLDYELGNLSEEETIALFQALVDTGLAWRLNGNYGKKARKLLEAGAIKTPGSKA